MTIFGKTHLDARVWRRLGPACEAPEFLDKKSQNTVIQVGTNYGNYGVTAADCGSAVPLLQSTVQPHLDRAASLRPRGALHYSGLALVHAHPPLPAPHAAELKDSGRLEARLDACEDALDPIERNVRRVEPLLARLAPPRPPHPPPTLCLPPRACTRSASKRTPHAPPALDLGWQHEDTGDWRGPRIRGRVRVRGFEDVKGLICPQDSKTRKTQGT
ncbi:hypothetical protein B0H17DRAFT_1279575 [Mycena rosella]|uniref:Uncharacterized protein n=1 Tax=Mycena rosella TaxID=1033263 RepID=A0AAD7C0B9_MYCRO|nr:hypothetical protein B0H17DRAFT_1279575 [Mycena rosella]